MNIKHCTQKITPEVLKQKIDQAKATYIELEQTEPRAELAEYDDFNKKLIIKLKNEVEFRIPVALIEGLSKASPKDISDVYVSLTGDSIHWEKLNLDFGIPELISGIFGTKVWMSELGKRGGSKSTQAKSNAARENGKKGGRPKKKALTA